MKKGMFFSVLIISQFCGSAFAESDSALLINNHYQTARTLVDEYPNADPMVLEHARQLLAGEPVKPWKNCLLEKTLNLAMLEKNQTEKAQTMLVDIK